MKYKNRRLPAFGVAAGRCLYMGKGLTAGRASAMIGETTQRMENAYAENSADHEL